MLIGPSDALRQSTALEAFLLENFRPAANTLLALLVQGDGLSRRTASG